MQLNQQNKITGGLLPLKKDARDFNYTKVFGAIKQITDEDFIVGSPELLDQGSSDFCTAFAGCAASSLQEGKTLNPYWSFAVSKQLSGNFEAYGQDLRTALKVHTKYGAIEEMINKGRDIAKYPTDLFFKAEEHKKQSYFSVSGKNLFNEIRSALFTHKSACVTGAIWKSDWTDAKDGIITDEMQGDGYGHAFIFIGQKTINEKLYLVVQLSNGKEIGSQGLFFFPESVVNRECVFGNFCFVDMPKDIAQKKSWSLYQKLLDFIIKLFKR